MHWFLLVPMALPLAYLLLARKSEIVQSPADHATLIVASFISDRWLVLFRLPFEREWREPNPGDSTEMMIVHPAAALFKKHICFNRL